MGSGYKKDNLILELTFKFSLKIIQYVELLEEKKKFVIGNQILKSGTSIGANVREAQNAESKKDFIHKFKIAAKEADELEYWLDLCNASENYPDNLGLKEELIVIIKIINKIISNSKSELSN